MTACDDEYGAIWHGSDTHAGHGTAGGAYGGKRDEKQLLRIVLFIHRLEDAAGYLTLRQASRPDGPIPLGEVDSVDCVDDRAGIVSVACPTEVVRLRGHGCVRARRPARPADAADREVGGVGIALREELERQLTEIDFVLNPMQDFSNNSDIDWSASIDDIDKQLFKKYNLSNNDIEFLEQ